MNIAGRTLGNGAPALIIAEIGVNHDGDADRAHELVDAAADAGADAVKVQFFRADLLLGAAPVLAAYQQTAGETDARAMLQRLELSNAALASIAVHARERGVLPVCTVFTPELVDEAEGMGFDAYKAASPDLVNRLLIDRLVQSGRPLILSTGAADLSEVERAVGWVETARERTALMHCVSAYPTPEEDATLGAVRVLRDRFALPAGYSDHTECVDTGAFAVAAGACLLEKHLTHSRAAPGPDHRSSIEPDEFARYVALVRRAERLLGADDKDVRLIEGDVRAAARQSLSLRRAVSSGEILTHAALTTRRPGDGLPAWAPECALGRRAVRDLEAGAALTEEDLA